MNKQGLMKKLLSILFIASALTGASLSTASEGWYGKAGLANLDLDAVSFNSIYVGAGYDFKMTESFYLAPEIRYTVGIDDDDFFGQSFDLDSGLFVGLRGTLKSENGFYGFGSVGWGDITVGTQGGDASDDEIGFGAGLGYEFSDKFALEVSFEDFDGSDLISLGTKFRF